MNFLTLITLFSLTLLSGCSTFNSVLGGNSSKQVLTNVTWNYQKDAIQVDLVSDKDLNYFAGEAHTVILGFYQFSDENGFPKFLGSGTDAIVDSLTTGTVSADILKIDRYTIQPGVKTVLKFDRVQMAKYVGVIVGFYNINMENNPQIFRIPVNMSSTGIITTTYTATPSILAFGMTLGRNKITRAEYLSYDAEKKAIVEKLPAKNQQPQNTSIDPKKINSSSSDVGVTKL